MQIESAQFTISNTDIQKCPSGNRPEFAFIGRSNVGKSSLINALWNQKRLAKTSSRPGKTQLINHFLINEQWFLVDLPGYGYARVSKTQKKKFQAYIETYFRERIQLVLSFVRITTDSFLPHLHQSRQTETQSYWTASHSLYRSITGRLGRSPSLFYYLSDKQRRSGVCNQCYRWHFTGFIRHTIRLFNI